MIIWRLKEISGNLPSPGPPPVTHP